MQDIEARALTRALKDLDRSIKAHGDKIRDLVKIAEALNQNLVALGRMMKQKVEEQDAPE